MKQRAVITSNGPAVMFYDARITPKDKKYSVYTPRGRLIHFGASSYEQYKDNVLGKYSKLNHLDKNRRKQYQARHSKSNYLNPEYPSYYSWHFLW